MGAPIAFAVAGSILKAYPAIAKARIAAAEAKLNSRLLMIDANETRRATFANEQKFRKTKSRELSSMMTAVGKAGVRMEGSALQAYAESAVNAEQDALELRFNGLRQAARTERQAAFGRVKAKNISAAGTIDAISSAVGGGMQGYTFGKSL